MLWPKLIGEFSLQHHNIERVTNTAIFKSIDLYRSGNHMNKKEKKKIDVLRQRINKLRTLLSAAKQQPDEPDEITNLEKDIAAAEAEIEKIKSAAG